MLLTDCVPDPGAFESDSEMGQLVSRVRKLLQEAEASPPSQPILPYDNQGSKQALQLLGLKIGDKVLVGGVKVNKACCKG